MVVSPALVRAAMPLSSLIGRAPHKDIGHLPYSSLVKAYAKSMSQCKQIQKSTNNSGSTNTAAQRELVEIRGEMDEVLIASLLHRRVAQIRTMFGDQQQALSYDSLPLLQVPEYNNNNPHEEETTTRSLFDEEDGNTTTNNSSNNHSGAMKFTNRLFVQESTLQQAASSSTNKHAFYMMAPDALVDPAFVRFLRGDHYGTVGGSTSTTPLPNPTFVIPFSSLHAALSTPSSTSNTASQRTEEDINVARNAVEFLRRALIGPLHKQFVVIPPSVEMGWVVSMMSMWVPPATLSESARNSPDVKKAMLQAVLSDPLATAGYTSYIANRRWSSPTPTTGSGGSNGGASMVQLCTSERGSRYKTLVADPFQITSSSPNSLGVLQLASKSTAHGAVINGCAKASESLRRRLENGQ